MAILMLDNTAAKTCRPWEDCLSFLIYCPLVLILLFLCCMSSWLGMARFFNKGEEGKHLRTTWKQIYSFSFSHSLTNNQTEWLRTSHSHEHANNCSSAEREKVGGEQWKWKDSVSHLPPPILFIPFTLPQSGPVLLIFSLSCHVYVNYVVHAHTQIYI